MLSIACPSTSAPVKPPSSTKSLKIRGVVPPESCLLFGLLTGTYTLMYNFALDLNQPFDGVYQVRRSAAATSLLGARLLLDGELPDGLLAIERGKQLGAEPGPADPRPC